MCDQYFIYKNKEHTSDQKLYQWDTKQELYVTIPVENEVVHFQHSSGLLFSYGTQGVIIDEEVYQNKTTCEYNKFTKQDNVWYLDGEIVNLSDYGIVIECDTLNEIQVWTKDVISIAVVDGKVKIPDRLLQKAGAFRALAYVNNETQGKTLQVEVFEIKEAPKTPGYVASFYPVITYPDLVELVNALNSLKDKLSVWSVEIDDEGTTPSAEIYFDENGAHLVFHHIGGGTDDYDILSNKPQINGHTLFGNKSLEALGIKNYDIDFWSTIRRLYNNEFIPISQNGYNYKVTLNTLTSYINNKVLEMITFNGRDECFVNFTQRFALNYEPYALTKEVDEAIDEVEEELQNVREVAEGKTATYVVSIEDNPEFDSMSDTITITGTITDVEGNEIEVSDLKKGDNIFVTEVPIFDRWVSSVDTNSATLHRLEATKVDLSNYYTKGETNTLLNNKADKTDLSDYLLIEEADGRFADKANRQYLYTFTPTTWTALTAAEKVGPYTHKAVLTPELPFGDNDEIELINGGQDCFIVNGLIIKSVDVEGQTITIYSVGEPTTATFQIGFREV